MAGIVGDEMGSPKSELSDEKADNSAENTAEEEPSLAANEASTNLEASTTANDANDESEYETLDEDDDDDDDDDNNEENSSPVIKPSKLRSKESDDDEDDGIDNENDEDDDDDDGSLDSRRQYSDSSIGDDLSDDIVVESERLDGDGQEKEIEDQKPKKLDDDEDRRNPQYIPKKGTFYEHDDRTCLESDDTAVNSTEPGVDSKSNDAKNVDSGKTNRSANRQKQVWTDKASGDKWHHDLYVEDEQSAKTPQELIDTYGYDIRSEEAPPKARRRRKYGRFYSKYDRDWENESAYKSGAMSGDRRGRTRNNNRRLNVDSAAEFPALNNKADSTPNRVRDQVNQESQQQRMSTTSQRREATFKDEEREDSFNRSKDAGPLPTKSILKMPNSSQNQHSKTRQTSRSRSRPRVHANSSNDGNAPAKDSNKEHVKFPPQCKPVDVSSLPKHVRGRGYFKPGIIPGKMEFTPSRGRGRRPAPVINSGYSGMQARPVPDVDHRPDQMMSSVNSVTQNLSKLEIAPAMPGSSSHESKLSNMIELHPAAVSLGLEKRIQNESPSGNNRSKRFSTQRQRSLPETNFSSPPAVVNGPAAPPTVPPPIVPPPVLGHDPTIGYYPTTQPPPNAPQVAPVPQNTPEQFNPMGELADFQTVSKQPIRGKDNSYHAQNCSNNGRNDCNHGENGSIDDFDEWLTNFITFVTPYKNKKNSHAALENDEENLDGIHNDGLSEREQQDMTEENDFIPAMEYFTIPPLNSENSNDGFIPSMMFYSNKSNGLAYNDCDSSRENNDDRQLKYSENLNSPQEVSIYNGNIELVNPSESQTNYLLEYNREIMSENVNHDRVELTFNVPIKKHFVRRRNFELQTIQEKNIFEMNSREVMLSGEEFPFNGQTENHVAPHQSIERQTVQEETVRGGGEIVLTGGEFPFNVQTQNHVAPHQRFDIQTINTTNNAQVVGGNELVFLRQATSPVYAVQNIGDCFPDWTFVPTNNSLPAQAPVNSNEILPNILQPLPPPTNSNMSEILQPELYPANYDFHPNFVEQPSYVYPASNASGAVIYPDGYVYGGGQMQHQLTEHLSYNYNNPFQQTNSIVPVPDYPPPPVFNESVPPPPVTSTAMPPPPQMVAFLPPGPPPPGPPPVPPPTAAPPFPPPSIINYVPTAAYSMPIRAPPVQQEVYQGQNGITYYSPQSQAAIPRQTPSRRKKVAIPIVPPPDQQGIVAMSGVMMSQPPPQCPPQLSQMPQSQTATVTPVVTEPGSET